MSPRLHTGTLVQVGKPSQAPPFGSRDHRVVVTLPAAERMVQSVEEDSAWLLDQHHGSPVGFLTHAWLEGKLLKYEVAAFCPLPEKRTSYEISGAQVLDLNQKIWRIASLDRLLAVALVGKKQNPAHNESKID